MRRLGSRHPLRVCFVRGIIMAMNEKEIRAVVANFVNRLRKKGFNQTRRFIVLEEKSGEYSLRLSDEKTDIFSIIYPDDLSEKSATATCELSGLLYYALKNRQRNLKAAHATPKEVRTAINRDAAQKRWREAKSEK